MSMNANNVVFTLSGFKRFLINPSGHVPDAAVSYGGSSVRAAGLLRRLQEMEMERVF